MKCLSINQSDLGGGAEKIAFNIVKKINENNIKCDLLVDIKKTDFKFVYSLNRNNITKKTAKLINKGLNLQGFFCGSRNFLNDFIKDYDIIHYHNLHGNFFDINSLYDISSNNIPAIWTLHDMWPLTGRCAIDYECEYRISGCGNCKNKKFSYPKMYIDNSRFMYEYKKDIISKCDITFVTPSNYLKGIVQNSFLSDKKIYTINNGIDLSIYKLNDKNELKNKYNLSVAKKYIIIIAAKLDNKYKGIDLVIELINRLKNKDKIGLIIVGNKFDNNLIQNIEIVNLGFIKEEKVLNELYSMADLFINFTRADNFPSTVLEAMASGTPVLSTKIGGIIEQIDEDSGWLVDSDETKYADNLVDKILFDDNVLKLKSENSRKRVEQNFSLDSCVNNYIELYKETINYKKNMEEVNETISFS